MEKIPKMSGVLQGGSCETCCNIPQKKHLWSGLPSSLQQDRCLFETSAATSYK